MGTPLSATKRRRPPAGRLHRSTGFAYSSPSKPTPTDSYRDESTERPLSEVRDIQGTRHPRRYGKGLADSIQANFDYQTAADRIGPIVFGDFPSVPPGCWSVSAVRSRPSPARRLEVAQGRMNQPGSAWTVTSAVGVPTMTDANNRYE